MDVQQWDAAGLQIRNLHLHALKETLVDGNTELFTQYLQSMSDPLYHQGLNEILILAVCRNQKWAVEILVNHPNCSTNFKNALAIQEASKDKNFEMVKFLYPLCNADLALTDMKMMDAPHLYETLEAYDLHVRLHQHVGEPSAPIKQRKI